MQGDLSKQKNVAMFMLLMYIKYLVACCVNMNWMYHEISSLFIKWASFLNFLTLESSEY